jgi:hypothetical protein
MTQPISVFLPDTAIANDAYLIEEFFRFIHYCVVNQRCCDFAVVKGPEVNTYCALYYEAQVSNGGHTQFIANTDNDMDLFAAARSGLAQIGAQAQEAIAGQMIDWVKTNAAEVEKVLNSPFQPDALDRLDDRFFDENKKHPVSAWAKTWIKQLPNLKIIPEREFLALLENPASAR